MSGDNETIWNKFTIEGFCDRSGASQVTIDSYRYYLGLMERWVGKPLVDASQRDVIALKARLRKMAASTGRQYATLLRMFYKVAASAAKDREEKERLRDLRDLLVL